ncbi:MAG: hypothetical protein Q9211_003136 [Gyalolechia sp. 1 TL-2023]
MTHEESGQEAEDEPSKQQACHGSSNPAPHMYGTRYGNYFQAKAELCRTTHPIINHPNRISVVSVSFSTLLRYMMLSHERAGSTVEILCPWSDEPLPSTSIILKNPDSSSRTQSMKIEFSTAFMIDFLRYAGPLEDVRLAQLAQ